MALFQSDNSQASYTPLYGAIAVNSVQVLSTLTASLVIRFIAFLPCQIETSSTE